MDKVCIVTPCYKETLSDFDKLTLVNYANVFKNRKRYILAPYKLKSYDYYNSLIKLGYLFKFIDDEWFKSIDSYNALCLSEFLYDLFLDFEYMLIAQLDAWAFKDDLDYWCSKNYAYLGGPFCYSCPACGNVQKCNEIHTAKDRSGQGGFSLRKPFEMKNYIHEKLNTSLYWEDRIFSASDLNKCDCHESKWFSMESDIMPNVINSNILPFGIHRFHCLSTTDFAIIQLKIQNDKLLQTFNSLNTNSSKIAMVCMAKNEDAYIDEWIKYHEMIGFDDFYIYTDNWNYNALKENIHIINVKNITSDTNYHAKQINSYNHFIKQYSSQYGYACFFDIDEFLNIGSYTSIQDAIYQLKILQHNAVISFNWLLFGNNNLDAVVNNNYSVINRFTKCENKFNKHVKVMINFNKCRNNVCFPNNPHQTNLDQITIDGHIFNNFAYDRSINEKLPIYINHYHCKTFQEYLVRSKSWLNKNNVKNQFDSHNKNDATDMSLKEKFKLLCQKK